MALEDFRYHWLRTKESTQKSGRRGRKREFLTVALLKGQNNMVMLGDNMVMISIAMTNDQWILREYGCGLSKVTTHHGLHIHQGKVKCGWSSQMQTWTATAGQTRRNQI